MATNYKLFDLLKGIITRVTPIKYGGTGKSTIAEARQNLNFIGKNPITSVAEDTPVNWAAFGTGIAGYDTLGMITDQPSRYGILVNQYFGTSLFQTWCGTNVNGTWYRRGNQNGWQGTWIKQLDENNGIQIKKLWQNASPTSAFAAQTLSLDLSEYDMVAIKHNYTNTSDSSDIQLYKVGDNGILRQLSGAASATVSYVSRDITVNTTGVVFEEGKGKSIASSSAGPTNNVNLIPVAIYGIKGVQ